MRSSVLFTTAALLGLSAAQQGLGDLPTCAQSCVTGNFLSSCGPVDIECICRQSDLISSLSCCIAQSCNADEQQRTIAFAQGICSPFVQLPSAAGCASTAASTEAAPTSEAAASTLPSGAVITGAPNATVTNAPINSSSGSAPASQSTGAAAQMGVGMGAVAAGLMAFF